MIIRRLAEGIRNQDWFVVAVEIMIVVVGIFIGLQVDDWNSERKNRDLELYYYEQLVTDLEGTILSLQNTIDYAKGVSDNAREAGRFLSEGLLNEETAESFQQHVYRSFFSANARINKVTLNQILSDKGMEVVQSRDIKRELGRYLETINAGVKWEDEWLSLIRAELVKIHHGIGWRNADEAVASSWEAMMANENLINSFAFVSSSQFQIARNELQLKDRTSDILALVKVELARLKESR